MWYYKYFIYYVNKVDTLKYKKTYTEHTRKY